MKLSLLLSLLLATTAAAQSTVLHDWTSNDQRTIQAHFIGVGASSVLIEKDGHVFHVPFSRLCGESVAQARRLGGQIATMAAATAPAAPALLENKPTLLRMPAPQPAIHVAKMPPPAVLAKVEVPRPRPLPAARPAMKPAAPLPPESAPAPGMLALNGKTATATSEVPYTVQRAIEAGNFLQTKPYIWGGGHGSVIDRGYDCSGSVSYVLIQAGLLSRPLTSSSFARYGEPGPGKYISIYAGPGHVFMTVCGLRLDTGGRGGRGESGPRWSSTARYGSHWTVRHPPGW